MKDLNEVKQVIKYLEIDAKAYADNFSASMIVSTKNILAIADAFRALEKEKDKAEVEKAGAEERIRMMFDAKNHWADRARAAEAKLETKEQELAQYVECFEAEAARADRNHAKLAEMERQERVGFEVVTQSGEVMTLCKPESGQSYLNMNCTLRDVFRRPAPAINLSELVPGDIPKDVYQVIYQECGGFVDSNANAQTIWNACLAAILRNIEEAE